MAVKGQPLQAKDVLPGGMSTDEFMMLAAGGFVLLMVVGVAWKMFGGTRNAARIRALQERRAMMKGNLVSQRRRKKQTSTESMNLMRRVVHKFDLLKSSQLAQAQKLLLEAGYRSKDAIVIYMFFSFLLPIVFSALGLVPMFIGLAGEQRLHKLLGLLTFLIMAYIGLKLPAIVVGRRRKKRYQNLQRSLSDTLDLMTICAEAGLSLGMTLERVSRELGLAYPEMAEELSLTSMELGFLPERNKALLNLAERVSLSEIRGIVSVLIQTEKYGTPIAQALRVLSAEFREQRMLRAETKAARLPAMMTVPMIVFILPTLFIVIISPAIVRMIDSWK